MRKYRKVDPSTKAEAEAIFAQGTSEQIRDALLGVTYSVEDWRWVQNACLTFLKHADPLVQEIAILCLGHIATFHQTLDLAVVLPVLQAYASRPDLASAIQRACDDIAFFVKDPSYFAEHWAELPEFMKESLITNHLFDTHGTFRKTHN